MIDNKIHATAPSLSTKSEKTGTLYSVVIPVYNSAKIVTKTVNRVCDYFATTNYLYEIILVNDGSPDESWDVISKIAKDNPQVTSINLLKNYGQHHANLCGFREANGDYVITMDDDLQNPPEEIHKLIETAQKGYDLVIGKFKTKKHSMIRKAGSKIVGCLNRKVFGVREKLTLTNFRIIHRSVVDRVCKDTSASPYIPGLVLKYSSNRANTLVEHHERHHGKSNYNWKKILTLVATILFNHSSIPLRLSATFGFLVSGISFVMGLFYLLHSLFVGSSTQGWATIVVLLSFFNGILILILSVMGEYIIRMLKEIDTRSSYEIKEIVK